MPAEASTSAAERSTARCSNCGKHAIRTCMGCKNAPRYGDFPRNIVYCNSSCQKLDWKNHKTACKKLQARKILYRAADTIQRAWYVFREHTFDNNIKKIEEDGKFLRLIDGPYDADIPKIGGHFFPFPNALVKNERDKKAILTVTMCDDAVGYLHKFIKELIEDVSVRIEEVQVSLRNKERITYCIRDDGEEDNVDWDHHILRVTIKDGEAYAIDITGAQYNMFECIFPWDEYVGLHISRIIRSRPFGSQKNQFTSWAIWNDLGGQICRIYADVVHIFDTEIAMWAKKANLTLTRMHQLPEGEFRIKQGEMLDHVAKTLQRFTFQARY